MSSTALLDRAVSCWAVLCCAGDCYRADHLLEAAIEAALEDAKNPLSPQAKRVSVVLHSSRFGRGERGAGHPRGGGGQRHTTHSAGRPRG